MAGDAPLLERLAKLPAVPAAVALELLKRLSQPQADPVIGPLFGVDEEGNAAVRAAVVTRLRASGLPPDDLLLRLGALSPTLGFAAEKPELAREWLADPFTQDALLVQQCVIRMLFALRAMADARAADLTTSQR